ncbi:MAG: metallophosphoesterase [Chloroflexota bacterium]
MAKIAVIGDIHHHFTDADVAYFNQSEEELLLFVGDLADYRPRRAYPIVERMARLKKTAVYLPGNHDAVTFPQLVGEVKRWPWLIQLGSMGQRWRVHALRKRLGPVVIGGYSHHHYPLSDLEITVIAARPHAMGGPHLAFAPYLRRQFGIRTLTESAARLKMCIDQAPTTRLIFLGHNGPTGLGNEQADLWGKDFDRRGGDWGDPDLREAIDYAREAGKDVTAVFAGHMHHALKFGGQRRWHMVKNGTHYVNAGRVPRISGSGEHHYVQLTVTDSETKVIEIVRQM